MNAISKIKTHSATEAPGSIVDAIGDLKAKIAHLTGEEKRLRDMLVQDHGAGEFEGNRFRATVSTSERNTLDMDAVREKLSPQFISAHTTTTPVTTVRVVARTRK